MWHKLRRSISNVYYNETTIEKDAHAFLAAGLRPRVDEVDLVAVAFLTGAFFAAAAFFVAVVPVTAFFAGARLEAVVVFLAGAAFFPATTFLAGTLALVVVAFAAGFAADFAAGLAADLGAGFFAAVDFFPTGFLAGVALVVAVLAVLGLEAVLALEAGLFSLAEVSAFALGASLILPLTPLGNAKVPFSAPVAIALLSCVF